MQWKRVGMVALICFASATVFIVPPVNAGCGCDKPPPLPAAIRPHFAYPGATVILFGSSLVAGDSYEVQFVSGTKNASATVHATAILARDQADGVEKPQLRVEVPGLPLGPTEVRVAYVNSAGSKKPKVTIPDTDFTIITTPIVFPAEDTTLDVHGYRTGVDRAGIAYIAFDLTNVDLATWFSGFAATMPFRLAPEQTEVYNTQGYFFESLADDPSIASITEGFGDDSDAVWYWRHEFQTYRDSHLAGGQFELSSEDPDYWHADGTAHVDHHHIVFAIPATLRDGSQLPAGATKAFKLHLETDN